MPKKYFFLFFLLTSLTAQSCAFSITDKIKNFVDVSSVGWATISSLVSTDFQFRVLGSENVSRPLEDSIRAILAELGLQQEKIHIKQMSDRLASIIGRANAIATANAIYVDEEFMHYLSPEQRRALIGHEGIHIKDKHVLWRLLAHCLGLAFYVSSEVLLLKKITDLKSLSLFTAGTAANVTAIVLGLLAYARYQERTADFKSAEFLQCHKGAADLWKLYQVPNEGNSLFAKLKAWVADKFSTHPNSDERCAYLSANL